MNNPVRTWIIIPALNEAGNIRRLVSEVQALSIPGVEISILVVDNGSSDATAQEARQAGAQVIFEPRRGYGFACAAGVSAAVDAELIAFLDGDHSSLPEEMQALLAPLLSGEADLVLGSRERGNILPGAMLTHQRFGNRLASWMMRLLYGIPVTDLGPYRAIRRKLLLSLEMREMTYGWPTEMTVKAARRKARLAEIPVSWQPRSSGRSKVSGTLRGTLLAAWYILRIILIYAIKPFSKPPTLPLRTTRLKARWNEIMNKPNFFTSGSPFLSHPLLTPERTRMEIDFILEQTRVPPGGRILDTGCGAGRHSIELARRGYRVLGIDPAAAMIEAAHLRAAELRCVVEFQQLRGEKFITKQPFDAVICLFTSLGQMDAHGDNLRLVERAYAVLRTGGWFVVEVPQRGWVELHLKTSDLFEQNEKTTDVERSFDPEENTVTEIFTVSTPTDRQTYLLRYYLFNREELRSLLENAGFDVEGEYGGYDASPLKPESPILIMVAQKSNS